MEKQIIEYRCAGASAILDLINQVNAMIGEGMQPFGGMVFNQVRDDNGQLGIVFYQPMVRYGDSLPPSDDAPFNWKWENHENVTSCY